jgi:hypothetical protein
MVRAHEAPWRVPIERAWLDARRRDVRLIRSVREIAALHLAGEHVEPVFLAPGGEPVPDEEARALGAELAPAVAALSRGTGAHARALIAEIRASRKTEGEQVDDVLAAVYRGHAAGSDSEDVIDPFLDTFEGWLSPDGVAKVDLLFDRVDLDRAPASLGIVLLATTRLTRTRFAHREAFVERLRAWLVGREGRTAKQVDTMLRGLLG